MKTIKEILDTVSNTNKQRIYAEVGKAVKTGKGTLKNNRPGFNKEQNEMINLLIKQAVEEYGDS